MGSFGSIFGYEDGGPVGMFLGGDPQAYGDERGKQDRMAGGTTNLRDTSRRVVRGKKSYDGSRSGVKS